MKDSPDLRPEVAYVLPVELRSELAEPFGPIFSTAGLADQIGSGDDVYAVGDVVSMTLHQLGIEPRLFVCDYKTQRGDEDPGFRAILGAWGDRERRVVNPAGLLSRDAWDAVRSSCGAPGTTRIVVDGEEDLLAIPCFLEAPDGAIVLYGMPSRGVVLVRTDEALRRRVRHLVRRLGTAEELT